MCEGEGESITGGERVRVMSEWTLRYLNAAVFSLSINSSARVMIMDAVLW